MKLKITDYFWSVGHKTRKVKTIYAKLVSGNIEAFKQEGIWQIVKAENDYAELTISRLDGVLIKSFTIAGKQEIYWRPYAFDGGHEYRMKLVRFF